MYRHATPSFLAILLLSCATSACGDGGEPTSPLEVTPVPTTLRVTGGLVALQVPQTTTVTAAVHDQLGRTMPSLTPTWVSRDTTTVRVTSAGTVTAVETGDAWLVATSAGLADSVVVRARFPVGEGEARMRTRHSGSDRSELMDFYGRSYDLVGTDALDRDYLEFDGSDGLLVLVAPPSTVPSEWSVEAWSTEQLAAGATIFEVPAPGGFFVVRGEEPLWYVGTSGYLDVTEAGTPTASGESVPLAGHLQLHAAGYTVQFEGDETLTFTPTGDSVTCDLDFAVSLPHRQVGYAITTVRGGPVTAETGWWDAYVGWPNVNPPDTPLVELTISRFGDVLTAMIHDPHRGDLSVYAQPPGGSFGAGNGLTSLRMTGYDPYFTASGQGGTLSLTEVVWPDAGGPGELSGTIEASMLYWLQNDPQNAQTGTVSVEFHALWPPKEGSQPAATAADRRSPWDPMIRRLLR